MKKSLIRHLLTALGTLLTVLGLSEFVPIIELLKDNINELVAAGMTLSGLITTIVGFFRQKERLK